MCHVLLRHLPQAANDTCKEARREYSLVTKECGSTGKVFSSVEEMFGLAKLLSCRATKEFGRLCLLCKSAKLRCGLTTFLSCRVPFLSPVAEFLFCPAKLLCNRARTEGNGSLSACNLLATAWNSRDVHLARGLLQKKSVAANPFVCFNSVR